MTMVRMMLCGMLPIAFVAACVDNHIPAQHEATERDDEAIAPLARQAFAPVSNETYALTTVTVDERGTANRLAIMLDLADAEDDADLPVMVRAVDAAGTVFDWQETEVTFAEGGLRTHLVTFDAEVVQADIRIDAEDLLRVQTLSPAFSTVQEEDAAELGVAEAAQSEAPLSSALSAIGVKPRSAWTTLGSACTSNDPNKYRMAIHHTVTQTGSTQAQYEAKMRQMRNWHRDQGWCDIGYHFVITVDGTIFEARPIKHIGAHVAYSNTGNIGISFMGCFHPTQCGAAGGPHQPTAAMINAAGKLVKKLSGIYGIARTSSKIKGHRQHPNVSKACPGDYVINLLPQIRNWNGNSGLPGFCAGKTGHWCVGDDLVECDSGDEVERTDCAHGCQSMPAGTPDQCKAPPAPTTFCNANGDKTGTWCDGTWLTVCDDGDRVSRTKCGNGCQSMPSGTPDQCVQTTFCNADGDKTGTWCDGDWLTVCDDGDRVSRNKCDNGCQSMPAGTPDQCVSVTFCNADGDKTGTWCDGKWLTVCDDGDLVSRNKCPVGCQSMPAGTPDQCKVDDFCYADGTKTGTWCDGNDLVMCDGGSLSSRTTCAQGCQSMPQGTPDQCN